LRRHEKAYGKDFTVPTALIPMTPRKAKRNVRLSPEEDFMGNIHSDNSASVTMTDKKTGAIVFAYAVDKKSTLHGQQTTAEACAKHLKNQIEEGSK
jgi:hypothetical protein